MRRNVLMPCERSLSVWGCSLVFLWGCATDVTSVADKAPRFPVSGVIMLNGAPSENVALVFIPKNGTPGMGGYAISRADGKFDVVDNNQAAGLQSGGYDVTFSKRVMLDGSPVPAGDGITGDMTKELLPAKYNEVQPEQHPFVANVTGPTTTLSFDLKVKK